MTIASMIRSVWEAMRYGSRPGPAARSKRWPAVEREHLRREPRCQWCGRLDHVEVHHILAFEDRPDLELDDTNLISLCRPPGSLFGTGADPLGSCHFQHGHGVDGKFSWKINNLHIRWECMMRKGKRGLVP